MPAQEILRIEPSGPLRGDIQVPGSKSVTNRALLLAALARGRSRLLGALDAEDTRHMTTALRGLGVEIRGDAPGEIVVSGTAGRIPAVRAELFLGNAGTAMRFLAAATSLGEGCYLLDGEPRMRQRPIGHLASTLQTLGASIAFRGKPGFPPLEVSGGPLAGGRALLQTDVSSQFTSALLMVGPCTGGGIRLELAGEAVSRPYVELTRELMTRFGGPQVSAAGGGLQVPGGAGYRGVELTIEADASSAAALFAAAAVTGGDVRVLRLRPDGHQPDLRFPELLEAMGCEVERQRDAIRVRGRRLRGLAADLAGCPDLAPALAAVALFAEGPTRVTGAAHLRFKESDRIGDLAAGLRKLGAGVEEHDDGFTVHPGPLSGAQLDPRGDHRLAMAYAVIGLQVPGVSLEDPRCVGKSFPGFFQALDSLRL